MTADRPNVVWITLESVRADHTTMDGYRRETTPNVQRLADESEGVWFPRCFSHARWTPASTASILTGTALTTHGVGLDGDDVRQVPADLATAPELFAERGYRTACVSSNGYVSSATGLDRGFDRFLWPSKRDLPRNAGSVLKYLVNYDRHRKLDFRSKRRNLSFAVMTGVAKRWLGSFAGGDEPFFMYLHYNNPHHPYTPPHPMLEEFVGDLDMTAQEAIEYARDVSENMWAVMADGCSFEPNERAALDATYDAEIVHVDEMVGAVVEHARSLDLADTVFVITADHGELFGECGVFGHNLVLHDGLLRVPLVIHGLDGVRDRADGLVQHADVMETLLGRVGADTSQFQGVQLDDGPREYAISQRGPRPGDIETLLEHNPSFDPDRYHAAMLHAIHSDAFKYQHSADRTELFELPDEETDVQDEHPSVAERMDRELQHQLATIDSAGRRGEGAAFTEAMERQLEDLGYL